MAVDRLKPKPSKLFNYNILDVKDDLDLRLEECQKSLSPSIGEVRETELYEQLNAKVCHSQQDHDETVLALLYLILTDPIHTAKWYSTLTMVTRDSMAIVLQISELLILEKLPRLMESTCTQLVWLANEMIRTGVTGADRLCFAFLKQMPGGSSSPQDIWLVRAILQLLTDNKAWMEGHNHLVASVVYTYLSLLPHHLTVPSLSQLKDDEIQLVVSLLQNKFQDCLLIGRDLVRLLQNVSRVPEFTSIWSTILNNPSKLCPSFTGVHQLLCKRTSRRFIAGRIATDAEIKLNFIMSKVKFGQHKRYQDWFVAKYLSSVDGLHMIPELIRFVCCVIHPTNEILGSDITPRWVVIGWLLSLCQTNQVIFMNAKLALFYDWLTYSSENDNIMNIEPAALLMFNSLRTHTQITVSLIDFICRVAMNYCPQIESQIKDGFTTAFNDIVNKGVLPSIDGLLFSVKVDKELRTLIKTVFPGFTSETGPTEDEGVIVVEDDPPITAEVMVMDSPQDDQFSPPTEDIEISEEVTVTEIMETLPTNLQEKLITLVSQCGLEELHGTITFIQKANYSKDIVNKSYEVIMDCIRDDFIESCVITDTQQDRLYPHVLNGLHTMCNASAVRHTQYKLGYFILYYCYHTKSYELYRNSVPSSMSLQDCLCSDLKVFVEEDRDVFFTVLPSLCIEFNKELVGCSQLVYIVVTNTDPCQLNELVIQLSLKQFILFGKQLQDIIIDSLSWDSFDQFCFWQLLSSESPEVHYTVPVLKHITSPSDHPEAVTGLILLLRQEPSIPSAVGNLLSLSHDTYGRIIEVVCARWISAKPNKMAKFIEYCLGKVQKLSDPLPTICIMFDNLQSILCHHVSSDEVFKASDSVLCVAISKLFITHPSLISRCLSLHKKINEFKFDMKATGKQRKWSEEDITIGRKRKRMLIEELSD